MTESDWVAYNNWNVRDAGLSSAWVESLSNYLIEHEQSKNLNILDYGCGYFDLGRALHGHFKRVDGYDPNASGLVLAKQEYKDANDVNIFESRNDLPDKKYNIIVLNSVVQYFEDSNEFELFLEKAYHLFKAAETNKIYLCDLIPENYSIVCDALENIYYAYKRNLLKQMLIHIFKSASSRSNTRLYKISPANLKKICQRHNFNVEILEKNLTPSRRRYTAVIYPA